MIREWVQNLLTLSDEDWGRYSFSREPLAGRITDLKREEYRSKAVCCGEDMANWLLNKYAGKTPQQIAQILGIKLLYSVAGTDSAYTMFACYEEPDTITIFSDIAAASDMIVSKYNLYELVGNIKTVDLLVAHELYHYLEQTVPGVYTSQKHMTLWKLGPFEGKVHIACLEEIGAMAFARKFTGLKCSPYIFDVIMLYGLNPTKAQRLYENFMGFKAD